jgi:glycogen debranching enzyme
VVVGREPDRESAAETAAPPTTTRIEERKQRVLTHGTPSVTSTIAEAVVIKDGDLFLLAEPDGRVPRSASHGFGLYYHDCRYLRTHEITLLGSRPVALGSTSAPGNFSAFELTNPDLQLPGGGTLKKESLGIRWLHKLAGGAPAMEDELTVQNWGRESLALELEFRFDALFEDVFEVRGLLTGEKREVGAPQWDGRSLHFEHVGEDKRLRGLTITFSTDVEPTGARSARIPFHVGPRDCHQLGIRFAVEEFSGPRRPEHQRKASPGSAKVPERQRARVSSDSLVLNGAIERSFGDLHLLESELHGRLFYAAGLPWFATLFGRDSILSSLQVLAYDSTVAEQTLRLLAELQGDRVDAWRDEQPGKILHELRVGELSRSGEIPHSPYYGTVDATPLFLILLGQHAQWTGDLRLFTDLEPHVARALEWIRRYGDGDGDSFVEYQSRSEHGLINQGWKDSGDAILDEHGAIATPPIALVEVQGYVYAAKLAVADLYRRTGRDDRARELLVDADDLRTKFNRQFWLADRNCYTLALDGSKRALNVIASNAGHALWSGIADPDKARLTAESLLADDMFSGWGVRTLATAEQGYNPVGYHLGTVWPHDNSLIAAGCKRYGQDGAARRIFEGILNAAMYFEHNRLPELFTGFSRAAYDEPIRYPVACHPQAWASGSIPYLLMSILGVQPDAFEQRLRIVRPSLPRSVDFLELHGLRVGSAGADLRFERAEGDTVAVRTLAVRGELDILVEPADGTSRPEQRK